MSERRQIERRIKREVIGTAKKIFRTSLYADRKLGIREAVSNGMTWMHIGKTPKENRKILITMNVGNTNDLWIEDFGPGFTNDSYKSLGHDADDALHNERMNDPNYISQLGIGIDSFLAMSKHLTVIFHTVYLDDKGRKNGLIATLTADDKDEWWEPEERPAPEYVLDHVGLRVIIKNPKPIAKQEIVNLIAETFTLKLKDFPVYIRDYRRDTDFEKIQPSQTFSTKHMIKLFDLSDGSEVIGDIQAADKALNVKIRACVKKVKMEDLWEPIKYLARGIITFNSLNVQFAANRTALRTDDDTLYNELIQKLNKWLEDHDFEQLTKEKEEKPKDKEGLEKIVSDIFMSLSDINKDIFDNLLTGIQNVNGMAGLVQQQTSGNKAGVEYDVKTAQKRVLVTTRPVGKVQRGKEKGGGGGGKPSEDPQYHGYEDGGDHNVLMPRIAEPDAEANAAKIIPDIKTEQIPNEGRKNVAYVDYDKEKNRIVMVINTAKELSVEIIRSYGKDQDRVAAPYFCKALADYVAEKEGMTREAYSDLWEDLTRRHYLRAREDENAKAAARHRT